MRQELTDKENAPLDNIEDWEADLKVRYPKPKSEEAKSKADYRNYHDSERVATVKEFYRLNHQYQTVDFVTKKQDEFLKFDKKEMPFWDAIDYLNTLVDDSDPDTNLDQLQHLLQTSEAIRADGHPDWFVLTGFIHDLGKVLCLFDEPQWGVVGDTFPVGCKHSDKVVYPEYFEANPDSKDQRYNTKYGIYEKNTGLDNVMMSWGHDEYLYHIVKDHLPEPALYMVRYHSFYAQHRENAYDHLMSDHDREMFKWVDKFNPYDLYSKVPVPPDAKALRPYYEDLVAKYLPATLKF
ncbi:inositol oxygenase family protein [Cyclobacterium amurskyense]|jgi:inositol oxygenase|uniref:Inositol oxygenase n=1 Tax=Cyclobacterium amurskyense TaxID=320787 RepID=A0A0H4PDJ1_9BACT|nr:inositol oxygenase family protein [Cyclobacterium amurskyense]AKP52496.1 Inositol oxygenase [Cyclobacterium amurskyense]|tara:strand:+ start:8171 stop:9052 length:882 start_codon:yes stop_codon:yes gene_type:complete